VTDPSRWWIFQPRGRGRRRLTPLGLAWTLGFYLLLGLGTVEALRRLAEFRAPAGPVLLVLLGPALWTGLKVCVDGEFIRAAAWLTGAGSMAVIHLLTEAPVCGTLVFGAGLPGVSPGVAPCLPHQDFMVLVFVAGWFVGGPLALMLLSGWDLYRWSRRDPLHAYRLRLD
jgi:hypothetical protein